LASLHQKHIDLSDDFTRTLEAFFDLLQQRFGVYLIEYPAVRHFSALSMRRINFRSNDFIMTLRHFPAPWSVEEFGSLPCREGRPNRFGITN
jgi:hypothetical protein